MKKEIIFEEFNKEVDTKSTKLYDILTKTTFKIKLSGFNIDKEMLFFSSDIPEEYKLIIDSG